MSLPHLSKVNWFIPILLVILAIFVLSAGCIASSLDASAIGKNHVYPEAAAIGAPSSLHTALNDFHMDFEILELAITGDLNTLSASYGYASTPAEMEAIGEEYYANNPWIRGMVYYDAVSNRYLELPVTLDVKYLPYLPSPNELDLKKAGGLLHEYAVFIPDYGYVNYFCKSVYDADGSYRGYVLIFYDSYIAMNLHPDLIDKDKTYDDCVCFLVDSMGRIIYSTMQESIGKSLTSGNPFYNSQALLEYTRSEYGAESYTSGALYNYLHTKTKKITAWLKTRSFSGDRLTIYVVSEPDRLSPEMENVYSFTTEATIENVTDLYIYAMQHGKYQSIWRVNSGYYSTPVMILDMGGNVLASENPDLIGLNYLSNHGAYGKSYTEMAILTAQQGGGFIYYTFPIDATADTAAYQFSLAYVMPIGKQCFIMGSFTGDADVILKDFNIMSDVTKVSREALKQVNLLGLDAVSEMINGNRSDGGDLFVQNLTTTIRDVSIYNYTGHVFASMDRPDLVGGSATQITDVYGGSVVRWAIMLSKNGGGFMNALTPNSDKKGYVNLWILLVEPVDDNYYIQTGAVIGTFKDVLTPYLASSGLWITK